MQQFDVNITTLATILCKRLHSLHSFTFFWGSWCGFMAVPLRFFLWCVRDVVSFPKTTLSLRCVCCVRKPPFTSLQGSCGKNCHALDNKQLGTTEQCLAGAWNDPPRQAPHTHTHTMRLHVLWRHIKCFGPKFSTFFCWLLQAPLYNPMAIEIT